MLGSGAAKAQRVKLHSRWWPSSLTSSPSMVRPSALTSLVALELRGDLPPDFAERVAWVRHGALMQTIDGQSGGNWTWRNARRLKQVRTMLGGRKLRAAPAEGPTGRDCGGARRPTPASDESALEPAAPSPAQLAPQPALTNEAAR